MMQAKDLTTKKRDAPSVAVVLRRRLDTTETGALTYLMTFLSELHELECQVTLIFVPQSAFGDIPVATIAQQFRDVVQDIVWPRTLNWGKYYISTSPKVYVRFARRVISELMSRLAGRKDKLPSRASQEIPRSEAQTLASLIALDTPDLVVAEYSSLAPFLDELDAKTTLRGVLLHDLFAQRAASLRSHGLKPDVVEIALGDEAERCRSADLLIYASRADRRTMKRLLPDKVHVWLKPKLLPSDWRAPVCSRRKAGARAFFLGVQHAGNLDSVEFLMAEIWPRVLDLRPTAELVIAGNIGDSVKMEWRALPGVTCVGFVPDLSEFAGPDTIALAPTRVASGVSIKVAKYLQLGMPTVASDEALTGYGGEIDDLVEKAADAERFAGAIVRLMDDPDGRIEMSSEGMEQIESRLVNDEFRNVLTSMFNSRVGVER